MQTIEFIVDSFNDVMWSSVLLILLVGTGLFMTIRLKFPQFRYFTTAFYNTFIKGFKTERKPGEVSPFQALAVAVAAQVGTGNVAGVATAVISGGPGAVFWMWLAGIFGMATIFAEASLAQIYREKRDGAMVGGPAYYISKGLREKGMDGLGKFLSVFFAIAIIVALGFVGQMVQSNSIAVSIDLAFGLPKLAVGIVVAALAAFVVIGGMDRISSFAEMVVPVMAVVYIGSAVIIMIMFRQHLGETFANIFIGAFTPEAIRGGILGVSIREAIRYGVARGLFSNEAGMGSTPHSHATAKVAHPIEQGMTAFMGVIICTFLICTSTALIITVTEANIVHMGTTGAEMSQMAFFEAFGDFGPKLLAVCLLFFAFTTIVGWYYFAEGNIKYIFGAKGINPFRVIFVIAVILGATLEVEMVWKLADMFNGIMVIPNLIGLWILSGKVRELVDNYDSQKLRGGEITYDYPPDARM